MGALLPFRKVSKPTYFGSHRSHIQLSRLVCASRHSSASGRWEEWHGVVWVSCNLNAGGSAIHDNFDGADEQEAIGEGEKGKGRRKREGEREYGWRERR